MRRNALVRLAASVLVALSVGCSSTEATPENGAGGSSGASGGSVGGAGGTGGAGGAGGVGGAGGTIGGGGNPGGAGPGDAGPGGAGSGGAGPGDAGTLVGNVVVDLIKDDHTGFLAVFFDGPPPPPIPLDVAAEQAGCKLVVPHLASCMPPCPDVQVCSATNVCTKRPAQVSVGTLHVRGLGGRDLDLEPTSPSVLSYQVVPTLPYPPCNEGAGVEAHADAFDVAAKCITALTVTSPVPIPVMPGQPMHLTWTLPAAVGASRIQIALEIAHHGGYKGEIDCDVADTGAFDIPEPLITSLIQLGRAGYPTVKVARTSVGVAPTQPGVKLILSSQAELEVDTGVISCGAGSQDCPAGTTCQADLTCR